MSYIIPKLKKGQILCEGGVLDLNTKQVLKLADSPFLKWLTEELYHVGNLTKRKKGFFDPTIVVGADDKDWLELTNKGGLSEVKWCHTNIGESTFRDCLSLKKVVISEGVEEIGKDAFNGCLYLRSVVLPNSLEEIGKAAFNYCFHLRSVVLPNSLKKIGEWAFANSSLTSIVIPKGVTEIGGWAFFACSSLKKVVISEGVKEIGKSAFKDCDNLRDIVLPESVERIGENAFAGCSSKLVIHCTREQISLLKMSGFNGRFCLKPELVAVQPSNSATHTR